MRWKSRLSACLLPVTVAIASPSVAEETAIEPGAVALLERSIEAHSSGPARLRLSYRGTITSPDQSAAPDGPNRPHPWSIDIALDEAAASFALRSDLGIDGGFTFPRQVGFSAGRGFGTRYTGEFDPVGEMPAEANAQLPHLLLKSVLKNAQSLRLANDPTFDRLAYTVAGGAETILLFDRRSHLLLSQERSPLPTAFGDRQTRLDFGPYRRVGQTMVPQAIAVRFQSPALGDFDYSLALVEATVGGPTAAELAPPAGATRRVPALAEFVTERFGTDAFLLRNAGTDGQFSYNVLVVPFADHVLVVEAALNDTTSQRVIEAVGRLAPGKPIRTLIQTHHHGDHIGGIRTYIAQGVQILAPVGTRGYIDRMAAAHSAVAPDALARAPRPAIVDEIEGERTLRDASNEARLIDIPGDHSAHMLVVYLPRQKLLYQGDLISAGELPINATSRAFLDWVQEKKLDVAVLAGLHGRTLAGDELRALLARGELKARH